MLSRFLIHVLFFCGCLHNFTNGVDLKLTMQEKIEVNNLFKVYNKPAVQELKTIHGETFSCIDFYKQPAFNHPSLQNHSYHPNMEFSSLPRESSWLSKIWANGKGCPTGTVPVKKYTKQEFIRTHIVFRKLYPSDEPVPGRFRACVHTKDGPHTFYGGSGAFCFYNFPVSKGQYSGSYLIIRAAEDQFQFGWMINPDMYGDGHTRLFLTTKVEKTKCFNLMCGGFVHTNKDVPLDLVLDPTTQRGASRSLEIVAKIVKDPQNHKWYLRGVDDILVGYWPNEVLKGLQKEAEYLEWGGEAYNPPGKELKGPPMGSGYFPIGDGKYDGYASKLTRYDYAGAGSMVGDDETEMYSDNNNFYRVLDGGFIDNNFGHMAYFGGTGMQ